MTWEHQRGVEPLVAASRAWCEERDRPEPRWTTRSLQAFEEQPLAELAEQFDLIVIDHPHVGIATESLLVPLDRCGRDRELEDLRAASLGPSLPSYEHSGALWALPIDGAAQVCAFRADLLDPPPSTWAQVLDLAVAAPLEIPLRPPHALLTLLSLTASLGGADAEGDVLIAPEAGDQALTVLATLVARIPSRCLDDDPIVAHERLAGGHSVCVPAVFGYSSYGRAGFREHRVSFADLPTLGPHDGGGSVLGGTGIAVSARSPLREDALDFTYWVASERVQSTVVVQNGGQPAHRAAWLDPVYNQLTAGFPSGTLRTHDRAWVRPRHSGWLAVQERGSSLLQDWLRSGATGSTGRLIARLNDLHAASRPARPR